jgi:Death effector domain
LAIIAKSLTPRQFEALKYLSTVDSLIPTAKLSEIRSGSELLAAFKDLELINPATNSCQLLVEMLETKSVGRADLARDLMKAGKY